MDAASHNSSALSRPTAIPTGIPTGIPRPGSRLPAPTTSKLPTTKTRPSIDTNFTAAAPPPPTRPQPKGIPPPGSIKSSSSASAPKGLATPAPSGTNLSSTSRLGGVQSKALTNGHRTVPKPTSTLNLASRGRVQNRSISTSKASSAADEDEHNDQLSSLDGFRSASRQGFLDEPVLQTMESVEPPSVAATTQQRRSSRPSLSERTIETLASLPSTPRDRRKSSFFNAPESPMGPPRRPASAMSRTSRSSSRPGTSDGSFSRPTSRAGEPVRKAPASARPATRTTNIGSKIGSLPVPGSAKRSVSTGLTSRLQEAKTPQPRATSPVKRPLTSLPSATPSKSLIGRKTIASSRMAKPRPPLGNALAPPSKVSAPSESSSTAAKASESKRVASNSSAALRQQIAAAKAAVKKEKENTSKNDSPLDLPDNADSTFETDFHVDPFNQAPKDEKHILRNRINNARMDGKLNIAAMSLKQIPSEVLQMYSASAMEESKVNWAEVVDLTKLIAADNELETIDDAVFPDRSHEELAADEDAEGNQFGGLELLDLHGNSLSAIPAGLRRLERLTNLNLTHNKLDNAVFDVLIQIPTLKELKIGYNNLTGTLPTSLCDLTNLEVLDVQANRILGLPEALRDLVSLRVLNVSGNQLTSLPMEALELIPLVELDVSSNSLIASLFPLGGQSGHPTLQTLNAANNSLAALTFSETLDMPRLRTLQLTNNHLTGLPSVTGWTDLITLHVGDNKLTDFPQGFTSLMRLRNVNFTSNEIRMLDPEISKMQSLESLVLASNPLREKKFLTMSAADIKRDLKSRLTPEFDDGIDDAEPGSPVTVVGAETTNSQWLVKANGVLDLADSDLFDDVNDKLASYLQDNEVKSLMLQQNQLTRIPPALSLAQYLRVLDLSGNTMSSDYLTAPIALPSLLELNLSKCRLTTLDHLTAHLDASSLETLTISNNRLTGPLPTLRAAFPSLTTLFAGDNRFSTLTAESLRGLSTVNLASNDLESLPAEIGLLWEEGLKSFEVGSNAFRVPNYRILEKGTEATLRWLRDRLPAPAAE